MKHLGDITKISGYEVEPVDVIIGGSPCQDLSIAGNRNGLAGERSGLFMEQIRIVKEMRQRDRNMGRTDDDVRPRWMVWENVPGAFSSNNKRDFQAVLTEIVRIAEPDAPDVPMPDKDGWAKSGVLYGEMGNWSIAYCVTDAQYWGTPQRRKRIALVADFNGLSAPDVLFDPKVRRTPPQAEPNKAVPDSGAQTGQSVQSVGTGLSGHSEPCGEAGQETAGAAGGGVEGAGVKILNHWDSQGNQIADSEGAYPTLRGCGGAGYQQGYCLDKGAISFQERAGKPGWGKGLLAQIEKTGALSTLNNQSVCASCSDGDKQTAFGICSKDSNAMKSQNPNSGFYRADTTRTLDKNGGNPTCNQGGVAVVSACSVDVRNGRENDDVNGTLQAKDTGWNLNNNQVVRVEQNRSLGLDHVMLSGGTTYQGRRWYDETSGCLKTEPHGVLAGVDASETESSGVMQNVEDRDG